MLVPIKLLIFVFFSFRSPTLIGCILVIEKEYFFEVGAFDEGMDIWGGENVELPVRVRRSEEK